jgi:hypothetical protein
MDLLLNGRSSSHHLWEEVRDVLACLRGINEELNGRPPTETPWQEKVQHLDREFFYAINLMLREAWTVALRQSDVPSPTNVEEIIKQVGS